MPGNLSRRTLTGEAGRRAALAKAQARIPLTQTETAILLRLTPQTVHAIEARALAKLRRALEAAVTPR